MLALTDILPFLRGWEYVLWTPPHPGFIVVNKSEQEVTRFYPPGWLVGAEIYVDDWFLATKIILDDKTVITYPRELQKRGLTSWNPRRPWLASSYQTFDPTNTKASHYIQVAPEPWLPFNKSIRLSVMLLDKDLVPPIVNVTTGDPGSTQTTATFTATVVLIRIRDKEEFMNSLRAFINRVWPSAAERRMIAEEVKAVSPPSREKEETGIFPFIFGR